MKAKYLLAALLFPLYAVAQPTVANNEYYIAGSTLQFADCQPDSAGNTGANYNWNFSTLQPVGGLYNIAITANVGTNPFPLANIVETMPDTTKYYIRQDNAKSYLEGIVNFHTGDTTKYLNNAFLLEARPMTYGDIANDSFRRYTLTQFSKAYVTLQADGYGTLTTPAGTFNNVIRIKRSVVEYDTNYAGLYPSMGYERTYLWFDGIHAAPLLSVDSTITTGNTTYTVRYYVGTEAVNNVSNNQSPYTALFQNNELVMNGAFENGNIYNVSIYNIVGQKMYKGSFTGNGKQQRIDIDRYLAPGMYMVNVDDRKGNAATIKVVKQ